jgi:hypothetical protein
MTRSKSFCAVLDARAERNLPAHLGVLDGDRSPAWTGDPTESSETTVLAGRDAGEDPLQDDLCALVATSEILI